MRYKATRFLQMTVVAAGLSVSVPAFAGTYVYVSNATDGSISTYAMSGDGKLAPGATVPVARLVMPMVVNPERTVLYAGVRSEPFRLHAYRIDPATGALTQLHESALPANMLFLSMDRTGKNLFAVSNSSNLIASYAVDAEGKVSDEPVQVVKTANYPHSIRIDATNRYLYVPSLAADVVEQHLFDATSGKISPNTPAQVSTGSEKGVRHFVISPDNRNLYVVSQFQGEVLTYAIDQNSGGLTKIGEVSGLPGNTKLHPGSERPPVSGQGPLPPDPNAIWAADIHLTDNGKFVYISERTTSQLIRFRRDTETGHLTYLGSTATEEQPRGFAIDEGGKYLIAAGEKSDHITVYTIAEADGDLKPIGRYPTGKGANWLEIVHTR